VRRPVRLPPEELAPYLLEGAAASAPLDLGAAFGNDQPLVVEVGAGKGLFLVTAGQANPDVNFLGIEIERKYCLFAATRLAKRRLGNVRVACADARAFFRDRLPAGCARAVHVYFPDPWWKTRHRKRRLFTAEFAGQCQRVLRPGGHLHLATDVEEYFGIITGLVRQCPAFEGLPPPEAREPAHDMDYLTNFERKYRKEGRPVYRASYHRRDVSAPGVSGPAAE
jgi:tRNA (guanine-N7-)-methyltransferase